MNEIPSHTMFDADNSAVPTTLPSDHPKVKTGKIGVLLVNLGTPDGTDYWSMRRYLAEFLTDKRVIEWPKAIWYPILYGIVLNRRPQKVGQAYEEIWNKELDESFLRTYTRAGNKNLIIGGVNPMPVERTVDARVLEELTNHLDAAGGEHQTLSGRTVAGPDPDKPILLHFGLHLPHTPVLPPQSIRRRFQQHAYDLPAFDQEEFDKLPLQLQKLQQATNSHTMTDAEKQQAIQDYYAFCALGDALIGEAVEAFQAY